MQLCHLYINQKQVDAFMEKKSKHYLQIYSFRFYYNNVLSSTKCQKFHSPSYTDDKLFVAKVSLTLCCNISRTQFMAMKKMYFSFVNFSE